MFTTFNSNLFLLYMYFNAFFLLYYNYFITLVIYEWIRIVFFFVLFQIFNNKMNKNEMHHII